MQIACITSPQTNIEHKKKKINHAAYSFEMLCSQKHQLCIEHIPSLIIYPLIFQNSKKPNLIGCEFALLGSFAQCFTLKLIQFMKLCRPWVNSKLYVFFEFQRILKQSILSTKCKQSSWLKQPKHFSNHEAPSQLARIVSLPKIVPNQKCS